ncbi:MAG: riboflavin synthase [Pseudomonadota bacterium]
MFTGIIEGMGTLRNIQPQGEGRRLSLETDIDLSGTRIGDSIAVNGACLTAVSVKQRLFQVDMAPETIARTTFSRLGPGARVNIERAMRLSDRLDGHLVSGHIDGTGIIVAREKKSNAVIVTIEVDKILAMDMIEKGSVAIDGISLTINRCSDKDFEVSVIPHTASITTIGIKGTGDAVNIETDMIGKYVRRFLARGHGTDSSDNAGKGGVSMALLAQNGFL